MFRMIDQQRLIVESLRDSLVHTKDQLNQFKQLYRQEKKDNAYVLKQYKILEERTQKIVREKSMISDRCKRSEKQLHKLQPPKQYKAYHRLTSYTMKRKRTLQYRNVLSNVFACMSDVKRARVSIRLGDDDANFIWSENEIRNLKSKRQQELLNNSQNSSNSSSMNHQSSSSISLSDSEPDSWNQAVSVALPQDDIDMGGGDENPDPSENEIFDVDGNWRQRFLRKIIHVMDKYKISHEAFHELRMVSIGYLPPVYRIQIEKKRMSEVVPYTKDESVCVECDSIVINCIFAFISMIK